MYYSADELREIARLRHVAERLGYRFFASRTRIDTPENHGGIRIVDAATDRVVAGHCFDLSIDDVARWLESRSREIARP